MRSRLSRLATSAVVIYATLLAILLADPRPVADWLDEFDPNPLVDGARICVDKIAFVSDALGTTALSAAVRARAKELMQRPNR